MKRLTVIAILVTTLAGVADARPYSPVRHCSLSHPELCYGASMAMAPLRSPPQYRYAPVTPAPAKLLYLADPHQDADMHWAGGGGGGGGR